MALYGLSVFLETPAPQRKGRKRYIAASLLITTFSALSGCIDIADYFNPLFSSTSAVELREMMSSRSPQASMYLLNITGVGLFMTIGDALLVST